jgi:hypothetical protein
MLAETRPAYVLVGETEIEAVCDPLKEPDTDLEIELK